MIDRSSKPFKDHEAETKKRNKLKYLPDPGAVHETFRGMVEKAENVMTDNQFKS